MQLPLRLPLLVGELLHGARGARPGVIDEHIEPLKPPEADVEQPLAGERMGHVEHERRRPAAGLLACLGGVGQALLATADEHDRRALGGERDRGRPSDASRGAGHGAHAITKSELHIVRS